jgi:hypothetical protein
MRPVLRRFFFCWADFLGDSVARVVRVARHDRTVLEGSVDMIGKVQVGTRGSCFRLLEFMVDLKVASLFKVAGR